MSERLPDPYEVVASPGWSPVAIPGRPGWWRHLIDGQQVDLPHSQTPRRHLTAVPQPEEQQ